MKKKSLLFIAYHFPPILGSSGVLRSLAFTRHMANSDWHTVVLSASLRSYEKWSEKQISMLPDNVEVIRAFARNSAKSFSIKGKYFAFMAQPDNLQSWIVGGVISGFRAIKKHKPDVIISTYPIASAHIIGYVLHRLSGIPWVADFRDPMAQEGYPSNVTTRKIFQWIERKAVQHCHRILVTTKGTQALYQARFSTANKQLFECIPNGYDEVAFAEVTASKCQSNKILILHSGIIYPSERDPSDLFKAIATLKNNDQLCSENVEVRLRATGHDGLFQPIIDEMGIGDIVKLQPIIPYSEALAEMLSADGLLLMQADNCNYQVPAKTYEYIYAQKPILGLMPSEGDTGRLLMDFSHCLLAPLDNSELIAKSMLEFLECIEKKEPINVEERGQYSRQYQAKRFEKVLNQIFE